MILRIIHMMLESIAHDIVLSVLFQLYFPHKG